MRIGVDLGGTKIEAVALDQAGRITARQGTATPRGDYRATVGAIADLVSGLEREMAAVGTVGIGIPGIVSPATGLVKNANSTCLIGQPLDRDLAAALARPVRLANDADCFALSEAIDGAAAGAASMFGVILGTGVGGGIVIGDQLVSGANAIAGEWGHNPLPWPKDQERPGAACYCGQSGCIETFLNGAGLVRGHDAETSTTNDHTAATIAAAAATGNEPARRALELYADRLARALAAVINLIDPEVIVLGGGLSNIDYLYERVPQLWSNWVFSDTIVTRLMANKHGASSGVRGAAWLWPTTPAAA